MCTVIWGVPNVYALQDPERHLAYTLGHLSAYRFLSPLPIPLPHHSMDQWPEVYTGQAPGAHNMYTLKGAHILYTLRRVCCDVGVVWAKVTRIYTPKGVPKVYAKCRSGSCSIRLKTCTFGTPQITVYSPLHVRIV